MSNRRTNTPGIVIRFTSLALLLCLWWGASIGLSDQQILPEPASVFALILREIQSGELLIHIAATLFRVVCAFVLAMGIGLVLGLTMGRIKTADRWFDVWLIVLLNLPALVVIVLCYMWIGLTEIAAVAAVAINKIPMVTVMIRDGARAFDPKLDRLATVFRVPRTIWLRDILIPQLAPHLASSARAGIALIWKIVLVVEFLGRPNGVGFQIHLGFQLFDVTMVLAYAIAFIVVMLLVEMAILSPLETRANRWRSA